jgi:hypothetical protein
MSGGSVGGLLPQLVLAQMLEQQKKKKQVARPSAAPPVRAKPSLTVVGTGLLRLVCLKDVTLQQRQNLTLRQHGGLGAASCSLQGQLRVHRVLQQDRARPEGLRGVLPPLLLGLHQGCSRDLSPAVCPMRQLMELVPLMCSQYPSV